MYANQTHHKHTPNMDSPVGEGDGYQKKHAKELLSAELSKARDDYNNREHTTVAQDIGPRLGAEKLSARHQRDNPLRLTSDSGFQEMMDHNLIHAKTEMSATLTNAKDEWKERMERASRSRPRSTVAQPAFSPLSATEKPAPRFKTPAELESEDKKAVRGKMSSELGKSKEEWVKRQTKINRTYTMRTKAAVRAARAAKGPTALDRYKMKKVNQQNDGSPHQQELLRQQLQEAEELWGSAGIAAKPGKGGSYSQPSTPRTRSTSPRTRRRRLAASAERLQRSGSSPASGGSPKNTNMLVGGGGGGVLGGRGLQSMRSRFDALPNGNGANGDGSGFAAKQRIGRSTSTGQTGHRRAKVAEESKASTLNGNGVAIALDAAADDSTSGMVEEQDEEKEPALQQEQYQQQEEPQEKGLVEDIV